MASQGGTENPDVGLPDVDLPDANLLEHAIAARSDVGFDPRYAKVEKLLREVPFEFEFFQAIRLLERIHPHRSAIGRFSSPDREVVRFMAHASFPFPASQIQKIDWPVVPGGSCVMVVNFMGLVGPSGVLPLYYTELVVERVRQKDPVMRDFLDIFNHRMISLFYQAWEKYRFTISYERGERDKFSHHLLDFIGLGSARLQERLLVRDESLLFYSGMIAMQSRPASVLERVLADYFDVPVEIEQFVGAWHRLEEGDLCRFEGGSDLSDMLTGAIVGDEIWSQESGVRIKLGPLGIRQYLDFLPSGTAHEPLKSLAKFVSRSELDFEVQLILKKDDVPACELSTDAEPAPRLGWTSWAKTQPMRENAGDTIFSI